MKFRKKPIVIEAVQWNKPGDHALVKTRDTEILIDRAGNYFYVSHADDQVKRPEVWLACDSESKAAQTNGEVLPFSMYELKIGARHTIQEQPELFEKYSKRYFEDKTPRTFGLIETLEGNHLVTPSDWIITGVKGEHYPCKHDIFLQTYEKVEE